MPSSSVIDRDEIRFDVLRKLGEKPTRKEPIERVPSTPTLPPPPEFFARFLLCAAPDAKAKSDVSVVWVDSDSSCNRPPDGDLRPAHGRNEDGSRWRTLWHLYQNPETLEIYAVRCPGTLSTQERGRLETDMPAGRWVSVRDGYLEQRRRAAREEKQETRKRWEDDKEATE